MVRDSGMLESYLNKIAERSRCGDISWIQTSPSTFQWIEEQNNNVFTVTIQKAASPRNFIASSGLQKPFQYLFQVFDKASKKTVVSISTTERPEFFPVLSDVYNGAERGMDMMATKILAQILRD